ncbi:MAG: B12-binding domain-containing radical SAM protein [Oscillospiraceae bacterium]
MKILLIRPRPHPDTIGLHNVMICEPLELMTLKPVLLANSHSVGILDMILEKRPLSHFIQKHRPDLVGITGYISHVGVIKSYAREIKALSPATKIVVGGVHAEVCPQDFASPHIDLVARSAEELYRFADCTDLTPRLPFRRLPERYRKHYYYMFHRDCALVKTSFGCPYNCNFCFCKEISPYSQRLMDDVIRELVSIPQKEVYIVDDDFLFDRKRLLEFADRVEKLQLRQRYLVYGRADFIAGNEDVIARLAQVGLRAVIVGLEAADQDQLDSYNKRTKLEDNERAVRVLQKYGIECYATVILGIDWDEKDFEKLYRFLHRLDITFVNLQPFTPMPGTPYLAENWNRLLIPYHQHEKWDMAHLVVAPEKLTVRRFYWETVKLYLRLMANPAKGAQMAEKYGMKDTLKLSAGAGKVAWQYLEKIVAGE